ncbi:rhomboid-like protein [Nocardia sp. R6R-6]|uniref:rhomboid-like protein n=1 Tax=Nocardia sp. R6R-6 TaxID=3459303 RepID=UPI00403DF1FD
MTRSTGPGDPHPAARRDHRTNRAGAIAHAVWSYIRRAPGTFIWLAILLVTTAVLNHLSPEAARVVLGDRSTNLHHLQEDPVRVLIASALWLPGGGRIWYWSWIWYLVLFNIFHVPAERWLGTLRWLGVVVTAHVGATYLSEGVLYWAIRHGYAPAEEVYTLDVGVSYALAGVVAVLVYRIARPWRFAYAAGVVVCYAIPLFEGRTFTDIGHFTAMLIGFMCYPLSFGRSVRPNFDSALEYPPR